MKVTLTDPLVRVEDWTPDLDRIGDYGLRIRKTPDEMREERRLARERFGASARKVSAVRVEHKSVLTHDAGRADVVYFLPGLWPRVRRELQLRRLQFEVEDRRTPDIRPELDVSAFDGVDFRAGQDTAIALIAKSDCGIIATSTAWGKSFCISLLCKALPTLNIVITTSSTQVVDTLYEYLCKTIPGQVGIIGGGKNRVDGKRVIVCTLKSLPNIDPKLVHLVLVDECHNVGDNLAGQELMKFCWARRFGFSASPVRNSGDQLVMESLLGPVIMKVDYDEAVESGMVTPMRYLMLQCASGPQGLNNPDLPDFLQRRLAYWCNSQRNRTIRNFVRDLQKVYDGQILIMASTLEHCIHLNLLLPDFVVAYYGNVDMEYLRKRFPAERYPGLDLSKYRTSKKDLDRIRGAFAKGTLRRVISTGVFRQGVNFVHLQVLVRADGDVSAIPGIQIPGRLARLDAGKDFALLVDVDDQFCTWAHNRSNVRRKLYEDQKWQQVSYGEALNDFSGGPEADNVPADGASPEE